MSDARKVGRIYRLNATHESGGVAFLLRHPKNYGHAPTLDEPRRPSGPMMSPGKVVPDDLFTRRRVCQNGACGLPHSPHPPVAGPALVPTSGRAPFREQTNDGGYRGPPLNARP